MQMLSVVWSVIYYRVHVWGHYTIEGCSLWQSKRCSFGFVVYKICCT